MYKHLKNKTIKKRTQKNNSYEHIYFELVVVFVVELIKMLRKKRYTFQNESLFQPYSPQAFSSCWLLNGRASETHQFNDL